MLPSNRQNTEIAKLIQSLTTLDQELTRELSETPVRRNSVFFLAEALAWSIIRLAQALIYSQRLGSPGSDADVFGVLQKASVLDLVSARKLKQFCELRHLSSREIYAIDENGVFETLRQRGEILALTRLIDKSN